MHDAGAEVVDHDVGGVDQAHQDFAPLGFFDGEPDTLLGSIGGEKEVVVRTFAVAELAARIFDRLDLENLGAVIAENLRAERTGEIAREIDNFDSREAAALLAGMTVKLLGSAKFAQVREVTSEDRAAHDANRLDEAGLSWS